MPPPAVFQSRLQTPQANRLLTDDELTLLTQQVFLSVLQKSTKGGAAKMINYGQTRDGLLSSFRRLQPTVPIPQRETWFNTVFKNYDVDKDGHINYPAFRDIVVQYYKHHATRSVATTAASESQDCTSNGEAHSPQLNSVIRQKLFAHEAELSGERGKESRGAGEVKKREANGMLPSRTKHPATASGKDLIITLRSHIMYPRYVYSERSVQDDYEFVRVAGSGSFGTVEIVKNRRTGQTRACKKIAIQFRQQWELVEAEIGLMKTLSHPNIIQLYESYHDKYTIYLILELCTGGPLFDAIVKPYRKFKSPFTEEQVANWMNQLIGACAYCEKRGVIHRDIKPENVLLASDQSSDVIKVIDFGLSNTLDKIKETQREVTEPRRGFRNSIARLLPSVFHLNGMTTVRRLKMQQAGTLHYMAPEMIRGQYDFKCDVFSAGIILFQLLSGEHPFYVTHVDDEESVKRKILNFDPPMDGPAWQGISSEAKDLVRQLLRKNPKKRIGAKVALQHPWFRRRFYPPAGPTSSLAQSVFEGLSEWQKHSRLKQAILQLLAKEMSHEAIQILNEKFNQFDTQGTGYITISQLKNSMSNSRYLESELDLLIKSIDPTGKGVIDYREFVSLLLARRAKFEETQLREVFNKLDANGAGRITVNDLKNALTKKGQKYKDVSEDEFASIFDEVDKNRQGYIDFDEFMDLMLEDSSAPEGPASPR